MSEDDQEPPPTDVGPPPEEVFALVGHEIRVEIIEVLAPVHELSLSELRSRLDADVEPSLLHYHLNQLVGRFVQKTDDGYKLNGIGTRLAWTLRAGAYDRQEERMVVDANFDCYTCQSPVEVQFTTGRVRIICPDCDHQYMVDYYDFPLDIFEDEARVYQHYKQYQILKMLFMACKICFNCGNRLNPTFFDPTERGSLDEYENFDVVINLCCTRCSAAWWQSVGMVARVDPGLISFCFEHGLDILSTPHWELDFAITDRHVTVRSTDPWEVALEVTFDGDTLELVVDEDLNVIERNQLRPAQENGVGLPANSACFEYIRQLRWPDGVTCPHCGGADTIKEGKTTKGAQRYRCNACDCKFNDLTGTLFAEHRLSLPEMVYIIREMDGTETAQIARELDRSYKSVLDFVHLVQEIRSETSEIDISDVRNAETIAGAQHNHENN